MANSSLHLQELFYKPAKSFVEVSQVDNQKIPEGEIQRIFSVIKLFLNLSPDPLRFEYAIYDG